MGVETVVDELRGVAGFPQQLVELPGDESTERMTVLGQDRHRGSHALGLRDQVQAERMKRLDRQPLDIGNAPEPPRSPLPQFLRRVPVVGDHQQRFRASDPGGQQVARAPDHDAGLAGAGARQHQVVVVVDDAGPPLRGGQRLRFDGVEQA